MAEAKVPDGAIILNVLHIIEFMDTDGQIYKQDFSHGCVDGEDLELGKSMELIEWARAFNTTQLLMEMVHDYCHDCDDDEDGVDA